ncbi:MAG TPA: NAD-dependent epimerase/dehydratase family protein [Chloroflexota bacterium]|nr:NAD-dependent epimerase/dehydratase family protein [Chloroflexota bacterium]
MQQDALVIGGTGFLGTAIVRELLAAGWTVTSAGRGRKANTVPEASFIQVDRGEPGALGAALGRREFDLVVDCAAYRRADAEQAVATLASRVRHYVFISTDFVYAPDLEGPFPITEDAPKERHAPYGVGKLECEATLTEAWQARGFPCTTLRPPHIMGAGKELGSGSVQGRDPQLLSHLRAGTDLTLLAEGQLLIQPVWHREVGTCIAHLAGNAQAFGKIFNCAGPTCVTTRRYYQLIADCLGVPLRAGSMETREYLARWPERAPFARHRLYDHRHLRETTGYVPHWPLEDAIAETVRWMEQQGS